MPHEQQSTNSTTTRTPRAPPRPFTAPSPAAGACGAAAAAGAENAADGVAAGACAAAHIRTAILVSLRDEPAHGYEVMRRLEEMSGGLWRPSPGSVYPHLQMLEDEGLVRSSEVDGSRTYTLTDAGRAEAEKAALPWQDGRRGRRPDPRRCGLAWASS